MINTLLDDINDDSLSNESISLNNAIKSLESIENRLVLEDCEFLLYEVIAEALCNLKTNPEMSIDDALNYGYREWVK